jgi:hypothetical protein
MTPRVLLLGLLLVIGGAGTFIVATELRLMALEERTDRLEMGLRTSCRSSTCRRRSRHEPTR